MKKLVSFYSLHLLAVFLLFSTAATGSQTEHFESQLFSEDMSMNVRKHANLISQCLEEVERSELHFYWTTGHTLSDNLDYNPDTTVKVGGEKCSQKFFPLLNLLLDISPKHLIVKFVCDPMTYNSNEIQIKSICASHGDRFKVVWVKDVLPNLEGWFPEHETEIGHVFQNASTGKPVLVSDIYRAIGLLFGYEVPRDVSNIIYTYCDVDTFCNEEGYKTDALIKSLFDPVTEKAKQPYFKFYFGRHPQNNDLIKIRVKDIEEYHYFCAKILEKIDMKNPVFWHFSNCHYNIREHEMYSNLPIDPQYFVYPFKNPGDSLADEVVQTTGPRLLDSKKIDFDLEYPLEFSGEWFAPEEILNYHIGVYQSYKPSLVVKWPSTLTSDQIKVITAFEKHCELYRKWLTVAFLGKRFGPKHPFNLRVRQTLVDLYPYNDKSFKNLLKKNREAYRKDYSVEDWQQMIASWSAEYECHYQAILRLLDDLKVEITLPTFDFMKDN